MIPCRVIVILMNKPRGDVNMFNFSKEADFDKLFIDTDYVYDVIFGTGTDWVTTKEGKTLYLAYALALQTEVNGEIQIYLHCGDNENSDNGGDMELEIFENADIMEREILLHLFENLEVITYTEEDKIYKDKVG